MSQLSVAPPDALPLEAMGIPVGSLQPSFEAMYHVHVKTVARWAMRLLGPSNRLRGRGSGRVPGG